MVKFKIDVDEGACIGCAACEAACDNFHLVDAKAKVKKAEVNDIGCNQEAADSCPVDCISIKKME